MVEKIKPMKPMMQKMCVEVTYWDFGNKDHRHKTEEIAEKCMRSTARRIERVTANDNMRMARCIYAMREVIGGKTYREVGQSMGYGTAK